MIIDKTKILFISPLMPGRSVGGVVQEYVYLTRILQENDLKEKGNTKDNSFISVYRMVCNILFFIKFMKEITKFVSVSIRLKSLTVSSPQY